MKIGIIAPNYYPIPSPHHTGEYLILDLVKSLIKMGHDISLFAPLGTDPSGAILYEMPCSNGSAEIDSSKYEEQCFNMHSNVLRKLDVIHDFSIGKRIAEIFYNEGRTNVICSPLSGSWNVPNPSFNITCWSNSMRDRALRGATDYENTPTPNANTKVYKPIKNAHVVYAGINTNWYVPTYNKKGYFLWLGRWHEVRGYRMAIEIAKKTGINLIMAGEHPDREKFEYQRNCVYEALDLASGFSNINFEWLPPDPYHHERKRELYQGAIALLNTVQFQEPFGLQQPEAMACGTPVIGNRFGALSETITNGVTGYLCDNSINDFEIAIKMINKIDPKICREHAVLRFDRDQMAKSFLAEYELVTNGVVWGEIPQKVNIQTNIQTFKNKQFKTIIGNAHPDYSNDTFEKEEHEFREKYWNIKENDVVFDIGSSYGSYALTASVMGAKVYAFEPEPNVFCDLLTNITINNWQTRCYPFNFGLYSSETSVDMKSYAPHWPAFTISQDYKVKTLDQIVNELQVNKIDWIKIDVEGVEEHVISGGSQTIAKFKPNMIIECHNFMNPNISNNVKNLLLSMADYEFEEIIREPCVLLYAKPKV